MFTQEWIRRTTHSLRIKNKYQLLTFLFCFVQSTLGQAGAIEISPLKLNLSEETPIQNLEIRNLTNEAMTVAFNVYGWRQEKNNNVFSQTKDIIITPAEITIAGKQSHTIQIKMANNLMDKQEKSYRLYAHEAINSAQTKVSQFSHAMRLGLPIFVAAQKSAPEQLVWQIKQQDKNIVVNVFNPGLHHVKLEEIVLQSNNSPWQQKHNLLHYVLAGAKHQFNFAIKNPLNENDSIHLIAKTAIGELKSQIESEDL